MFENDLVQNQHITVYVTPECPKCHELIDYLQQTGLIFGVVDVSDAKGLAQMREDNIFELEMPVLLIDNIYFTTNVLFKKGMFDIEWVDKALGV